MLKLKLAIDELSEDIMNKAKERINIQEMVENKINELDLYQLEELIIKVAKKIKAYRDIRISIRFLNRNNTRYYHNIYIKY